MPFDDTVKAIEDEVKRCRNYLRRIREYDTADDLDRVLGNVTRITARHNGELHRIKVDCGDIIAQQKADLIDVRKQLEDEKLSVRTIQTRLDDEKNAAAKKIDDAYKNGLAEGQGQRQNPRNAAEETIAGLIRKGDQAFGQSDFVTARSFLLDAKRALTTLAPDRQRQYDTPKLHYQLAVSGAYVSDIYQAEASLATFLEHFSASSDREELYVAHAQHLMSQIQIGRGKLVEALLMCVKAESTRKAKIPGTNRHYQSLALYARLSDLSDQSIRQAEIIRQSIPYDTRDALVQAYGKLKSIDRAATPAWNTFVPSLPATELLPVWMMTKQTAGPGPLPQPQPGPSSTQSSQPPQTQSSQPPQIQPTTPNFPVLDPHRERLLAVLGLTTNPGRPLSYELKRAIVSGDKQGVANELARSRVASVPALHLAAFVGKVEIANLLLASGCRVNDQTTCNSQKAGESVYGVTALHLAIGAQNSAMIDFLVRRGASFDCPPPPHGSTHKKPPAPPLWLLVDRWLDLPGNDDPTKVVEILRTMELLGWNTNAPLNKDRKTMRELAMDKLRTRPALKRAVVGFLDGRLG